MIKNRKLNRLKDYDYSQEGYYFVTVCTKDRQEWFGEIKEGRMILNRCGELVQKRWVEISKHFDEVQLDEYIVMPNHVHGIIVIGGDGVGKRQYQKLPVVIGSYKSAVTKSVHKIPGTHHFQWQKSFHDHIIRNEQDLTRIREYIRNNPLKWEEDVENVGTEQCSVPTVLCRVRDLGLIDYAQAFQTQKQIVDEIIKGAPDTLLLCEHEPVFTLGRVATEENFLMPQKAIEAKGFKIIRIDRGGEVTLHVPGQIVTYPIFNLNHFRRDLKYFLYKLEQVAIDLLRDFDIVARRISGQRGVWVGPEKIASLGIGVKKWVSFHGMAINVNTDLKLFSMIKPCGLDVKMTSLSKLIGKSVDMKDIKEKIVRSYCCNFDLTVEHN